MLGTVDTPVIQIKNRELEVLLALLLMTRGIWLILPFVLISGFSQSPRNAVLEGIAPLVFWGITCLALSAGQILSLSHPWQLLVIGVAVGSAAVWAIQGVLLVKVSSGSTEVSVWYLLFASASLLKLRWDE